MGDKNAAAGADAGVVEPGDMQRGMEEDLFCGVCEPDLCESEDSQSSSEEDGEEDVRGLSEDARTALNEVISGLGSRGGGLQEKDRKALDRLVAAERTAHKGVKRKRAGPSVAPSGVAFRCDMLVTKEEGKVGGREGSSIVWRSMGCDDGDDFKALKAQH